MLVVLDIDIPPTPTSSRQKRHGMFASAPHLKAFHNQLHVYHPLTEGFVKLRDVFLFLYKLEVYNEMYCPLLTTVQMFHL